MIAQHVGHGGDDRVGVLRLDAHQQTDRHHVGNDVGEELRVLHLPGHHGLRDAGLLEQVDPCPELSQRDAMQRRRRRLRRLAFEFGERLFLEGDDGDLVARRARRLEDEEGKPAVAGNQT